MTGERGKRRGRSTLALFSALALGVGAVGLVWADNPNERPVKPEVNVQDPDALFDKDGNPKEDSKIWVLDFKFKDPRLIKVDVPGRGQKVCWYLWYQVTNYTKEPRLFIPDFELVTHDTNKVYHDQVLPKVQEAIRQIEDPTGYLNIKNSVTIAAEPIPVSRKDAAPRTVTGVAIWMDPDEPYPTDDEKTRQEKDKQAKLAESNRYSIFVAGLSNGWTVTDPIPPETQSVVRRKTLQLNFKRLGDRYLQKSEEIRFVPPAQWMYRGAKLAVPGLPGKKEEPKKVEGEKKDR